MDKNINIKITTKADAKAINTVADRVKTLGNTSRTTTNSVKGLDNSVGSFVKRNNSLKNTSKQFDNIGNSVKKTAKDFDNLDIKTKTSSSSMASYSNAISRVQSKLVKFAAVVVPILTVAKASKELYTQGINYNKTIESLSSGLGTLAVVTSKNIDSTGKYLTIQEKYALANREATKSIEELTKINASTPHTLDQTVEIYKAMYASMKNVGVSNREMIDLTQKLSVTAGSAGIEFNQLLAGVDGLATGTVMSNSELGRLLGSLGLTNETLKKSSNIYETINSKLKDVQPLETYDTAVSNLSNSFNILAGASVEPFFDDVKKGINSTSNLLTKLTTQVNNFYDNFKEIDELTTINQLNKRAIDVYSQIEEKTKSLEETSLFEKMFGKGGDGKIKAEIRALNLELIALNKQYENTITKEETNKKRTLVAKKNTNEKVDTPADIAKKIKQQQDAYNSFIQITGSEYEKWLNSTNQKMVSLANSGVLTAQQLQTAWDSMENEYEINLKIKQIDQDSLEYESMLEGQLALIDSTNAWGNSLDGVAGSIANVMGSFKNLYKLDLKQKKQQNKIDTKYAKTKAKYAEDSIEYIEAENDWIMQTSQNKQNAQNAEIAGYANLAGAMAGAFEQGSAGAIAFQTIQATLGIASSWTAIAQAWALGYPQNIAAVAMVASNVMPIIGTLSSMGGGSGGGSASYSQQEIDKFNIEGTYNPVIERLDRQIELLRAIEKNGSASALEVAKAAVTFQRDYALFVNENLSELHTSINASWGTNQGTAKGRLGSEAALEEYLGFNLANVAADESARINKNVLKQSFNFMKLIQAANTDLVKGTDWQILFDKGWEKAGSPGQMNKIRIAELTSEFQGLLSEYTLSLLESMDELTDAKEDFEGYYDSLTGTNFYEEKKLKKAYDEVESLTKGQPLSSYLQTEIENIESLKAHLTESDIATLLLEDPEKLEKQLAIIENLQDKTGMVFDAGARAALDYMDSIEQVAGMMETSIQNTKTWRDDLKTDMQLAQDLASSIDITYLAKDIEELNSLFINLKDSTYGLTDAGLELLQANKSLIEDYTDIIKEIDNIISPKTLTLDSITVKDASLDTAEDILEQLKEAKQAEIDRVTEENNNRKTELQERQKQLKEEQKTVQNLVKAFENTTKSLNSTYRDIMGLSENADSFTVAEYNRLYKEIKDGIENKADVSSLTSDFSKYATSYAEYIKADSRTSEEYERRLKTLANSVKDLAGKSESATLNDLNKSLESSTLVLNSIDKQIEALDINLQTAINSVNSTYIQQMQGLKSALENSFKNNTNNTSNTDNINPNIAAAFKEVLGRTPDINSAGYSYWENALLNNPTVTEDNLSVSVAKGANNYEDIDKSLNWLAANNIKYGQDLINKNYAASNISDKEANTLLDKYGISDYDSSSLYGLNYELFKKVVSSKVIPFANGGIVQGGRGGVIGHIGEKDYSELIIPLDGRDFFGLEELKDLIRGQNEVIQDNISRTTIIQTSSYIKEEKTQKENDVLEKIVAELRRLNIISSKHAEATKKVLKTQKQTLLKDLQGA
ncbi:MAG: hypothetical protein PQJ49_05045 [Sphaerochaetaceae bacterium]|nr:hypothetical protein [Sphaerochaetaceae bacterium]